MATLTEDMFTKFETQEELSKVKPGAPVNNVFTIFSIVVSS